MRSLHPRRPIFASRSLGTLAAVALTEIVTSQRASLRRVAQIVELVLRTQDQSASGARWLVATRAERAELADRLDAKRKAFDQAVCKDQGVLVRWLSGPLIEPSELDACAADCLPRLNNAANRLASALHHQRAGAYRPAGRGGRVLGPARNDCERAAAAPQAGLAQEAARRQIALPCLASP